MDLENSKSNSDVSSDLSWTVINQSESNNSFENLNVTQLDQEPEEEKTSKKPKKKIIDYTNFLSIVACLMTITGITLLSSLLPGDYADVQPMQRHLADVYEHIHDPSMEDSLNSIRATIEVMDRAKNLDLQSILSNNVTDEDVCVPFLPELPEDSSAIGASVESLRNVTFKPGKLEKISKSLEDLVKSPTFQILVATLLQDVCLIKLITEFSKRTNETSQEPKKEPPKVVAKSRKTPQRPENHLDNSESLVVENGKSECERRFEELDNRWSSLGENHRQKIQQIKAKFQKELFQIQEQEKESFNRKQKIFFTREKFLQRLKMDREIYLHRLRKLREERQKVLREVCQRYRTSRNLKDVSVGSLAVRLPSNYNFSQKLQDMKDKEGLALGPSLQVTHNDTFSYKPPDKKEKKKRKRAKVLKKQSEEVQNVVSNIVSSLSEVENEEDKDFQVVSRKRRTKKSLGNIYDAAFEDRSKKIRQHDEAKWTKKFSDFKPPGGVMEKSDPQRAYKKRIMHQGLL